MNPNKPSTFYSMLTDDFMNLELRMLGTRLAGSLHNLNRAAAAEEAERRACKNAILDDLAQAAVGTEGKMRSFNAILDDLFAEILPPGMSMMLRDMEYMPLAWESPFRKHLAKHRGPCKARKMKKQFNMRYGI